MKKASLLFYTGRYHRRALLPSEGPSDDVVRKVAVFDASHVRKGERFVSLTPLRTKPFSETVPDAVRIGADRFPFERGVCKFVKVGAADALARADEIDAEIARLSREQTEVLEDAFLRGRPLRKSDLVNEEEGSAS